MLTLKDFDAGKKTIWVKFGDRDVTVIYHVVGEHTLYVSVLMGNFDLWLRITALVIAWDPDGKLESPGTREELEKAPAGLLQTVWDAICLDLRPDEELRQALLLLQLNRGGKVLPQ